MINLEAFSVIDRTRNRPNAGNVPGLLSRRDQRWKAYSNR